MSSCGSCGTDCNCGSGCSCEGIQNTTSATLIAVVAPPAKMYSDGAENSFGVEGGNACKCGSSCSCDPCNC